MMGVQDGRSFLRHVILFAVVANLAATLVIHGERSMLPYVGQRIEDQARSSELASELEAYVRSIGRLHVAVGGDRP